MFGVATSMLKQRRVKDRDDVLAISVFPDNISACGDRNIYRTGVLSADSVISFSRCIQCHWSCVYVYTVVHKIAWKLLWRWLLYQLL